MYLQWYYPRRVSVRERWGGKEGMKMVMIKLRMEEASEAAGRVALPRHSQHIHTAPSSGLRGGDVL